MAALARRQVLAETVNLDPALIQAANAAQGAGTHLPGSRTHFDALSPEMQTAWKTSMYCILINLFALIFLMHSSSVIRSIEPNTPDAAVASLTSAYLGHLQRPLIFADVVANNYYYPTPDVSKAST
jgi:hypothetical protein